MATRRPPRSPAARARGAITVLVADAQRTMAEALAGALAAERDLTVLKTHPRTGFDTVEAISRVRPAVAVVDLWMPELAGPDVARAVGERQLPTRVLLMSAIHSPDHIRAALSAGAVGFLPKGLRVEQVVDAVRRAYRGENPVFEQQLRALIERLEGRVRLAEEMAARVARLTPREVQVLRLVGAGLNLGEVAERLGMAKATARTHMGNILSKLDVRSQLEALAVARDRGILE